MINTVLFGAGIYGDNYMNNNKDKNFIAIVDNDKNKHNTLFNSIKVLSVDLMLNLDYDEIVIASYWESSIKRQLIDLGVSKDKIICPPKKEIKHLSINPFEDRETINMARNIITSICGKAYKRNIPLHIDFGTLIGIMRDGDLIPWDDDIDLAIEESYSKEIEEFIKNDAFYNYKDIKWVITKIVDKDLNVVSFDLNFTSQSIKQFTISIALKRIVDDKVIKIGSLGQWFNPSHCIETLEVLNWKGTNIFIPSSFDEYLTFMYGDWRTPVRDVSIGEEYTTNFQHVSFEDFKEAGFKNIIIYEKG